MLTNKELKKVKAARITPKFLKSPAAKKAAEEGFRDGLRISAPNADKLL